jgi:hypothetical protein
MYLDNSHTRGNLHRTRNQQLPAGRILIATHSVETARRPQSRRASIFGAPARRVLAADLAERNPETCRLSTARRRRGSLAKRHSHKPSLATVFDYSCALAQGDWCPGPALTCGQVRCFRNLKVLDAGQVLYDVLAVGIPCIDAVSEMGAIVYRHRSLPQSSSFLPLHRRASWAF